MGIDWQSLVVKAPITSYQRLAKNKDKLLARYVPMSTFDKSTSPSFLYASGNLGRCNPKGVHCVYFGEGSETARTEFDSYNPEPLPEIGFYARAKFPAILDLENSDTCAHFGLTDKDFTRSYYTKDGSLIPLQEIGLAVLCQERVLAIRFPSNAMHKKGKAGFNIVVFQDLVAAPAFLEIMDGFKVLERWPK